MGCTSKECNKSENQSCALCGNHEIREASAEVSPLDDMVILRTDSSEVPTPDPREKKYTALDMRRAFRHGREYQISESVNSDTNYGDVDEKHWPFWEWLKASAL